MSDTTLSEPKVPLGVGAIISESFSILFSNFIKVMFLAFGGTFILFLIGAFVITQPNFTSQEDILTQMWTYLGAIFVVSIAVYGVVTAMLVQLAYDAKLNRSHGMGTYFSTALRSVVPILILSAVVGIAVGLGFIALIVPGLWLLGVFAVVTPAVVIERAGFGALGRSIELTKEYRWPIIGALIIVGIISNVIQKVGEFIAQLAVGSAGFGTGAIITYGIIFSLLAAIGYGLGGISSALIYARLREIKEGVSVDEIASVFD